MTNTGVSVTPGTDTNKTGFIVGVSDIAVVINGVLTYKYPFC